MSTLSVRFRSARLAARGSVNRTSASQVAVDARARKRVSLPVVEGLPGDRLRKP